MRYRLGKKGEEEGIFRAVKEKLSEKQVEIGERLMDI